MFLELCHAVVFIWGFGFVFFFESERKREKGGGEGETDLLFHLLVHSLVQSCMCPDQVSNPWPWCIRSVLPGLVVLYFLDDKAVWFPPALFPSSKAAALRLNVDHSLQSRHWESAGQGWGFASSTRVSDCSATFEHPPLPVTGASGSFPSVPAHDENPPCGFLLTRRPRRCNFSV